MCLIVICIFIFGFLFQMFLQFSFGIPSCRSCWSNSGLSRFSKTSYAPRRGFDFPTSWQLSGSRWTFLASFSFSLASSYAKCGPRSGISNGQLGASACLFSLGRSEWKDVILTQWCTHTATGQRADILMRLLPVFWGIQELRCHFIEFSQSSFRYPSFLHVQGRRWRGFPSA